MALEVAGVFHGKLYFLFTEVVLAEDVEPVFLEVSVEARAYLSYLALDDTPKWQG